MRAADLLQLLTEEKHADARASLLSFTPLPEELPQMAAIALQLGQPTLAARWWREVLARQQGDLAPARLGLAAALCRLGCGEAAWATLRDDAASARVSVLRARALFVWKRAEGADPGADALEQARQAREVARREGDAGALTAAVTLLGEILLARGECRQALHALAEGLKVAELTARPADPHLLAVLALVQGEVGSERKARLTAHKALERSQPGSPARVLALRALRRTQDAQQEALAGELAAYL